MLITDAKALLAHTSSSIADIYHPANQCANHLAHMGADQDEDLVVIEDPPQSVRQDEMGTGNQQSAWKHGRNSVKWLKGSQKSVYLLYPNFFGSLLNWVKLSLTQMAH